MQGQEQALKRRIVGCLFILIALNTAFWFGSKYVYARWAGVPPVPSIKGAVMMALGDEEFSYRSGSLTLQMLGDGGGEVTPIDEYDFEKLSAWFWLLNTLNPASEHLPQVAGYYFGATRKPENAKIVASFLGSIGNSPVDEKWRWLWQAAWLARYRAHDLTLALDYAYKLARIKPLNGKELPIWARQMPAFILTAKGEKDAARKLMEDMLKSKEHVEWHDENTLKHYLEHQLGVPKNEIETLVNERDKKKKE